MPDLNVGGNFRQDTGGTIRPATVQKPIKVDDVRVGNIITTPVGCITRSCSQSVPYVSYICTVSFSANCAPSLPQEFPVNGIMPPNIAPPYYENATTNIRLVPPIADDEDFGNPPLDFKYLGGAWIKLKDTSFTRYPTASTKMTNNMPYVIESFDGDDSGRLGMIDETSLGGAGYIAGDNTHIDILPLNTVSFYNNFRLDSPNYTFGGDKSTMIDTLQFQVDSILNSKATNTVSIISGDLTLDRGSINILQGNGLSVDDLDLVGGSASDPTVLIIKDGANLGSITFTKNVNRLTKSPLLVLSRGMATDPSVTEMYGVFVSTGDFDTGASGNTLKIVGNLIALDGLNQGRSRQDGDHGKPSLFVIFDAEMYMRLFTHISLNNISRR